MPRFVDLERYVVIVGQGIGQQRFNDGPGQLRLPSRPASFTTGASVMHPGTPRAGVRQHAGRDHVSDSAPVSVVRECVGQLPVRPLFAARDSCAAVHAQRWRRGNDHSQRTAPHQSAKSSTHRVPSVKHSVTPSSLLMMPQMVLPSNLSMGRCYAIVDASVNI